MRKNRRAPRFTACAIATVAAAAGTLAFTGSALAATYNVTNEATFESAVASINAAASSAPGPNTINVAGSTTAYNPAATIDLTNTTGTLTIQGPAPVATVNGTRATFTGGSIVPSGSTLFAVSSGVTVDFDNIEIVTAGSPGNGVIDDNGTVALDQTTITGAGPALTVESGATASTLNSTISDGLDVGIVDDGTLTLTNTTVTRNSNGGVDNANGTLSLINSIVAKNGSPDCTAVANTVDKSLDGDGTCGVGALSSLNPNLGSLGTHGGTTLTDIPATGSPVIAAGDPAHCPTVDEEGAASPSVAGHACDIGSVETYYGVAPVIATAPVHVSSPSAAGTVANYTITWTAGSPVTSGSCSPASGSTFPVGATTVTCTGTDSVFGATGNSTFTVTDTQSTPPTVTTSGNKTVAATSHAGATVTFTASATDAVDGTDPTTCSAPLGAGSPPAAVTVTSGTTVFPIATTTVTCSATDSAGLTGTATFTVTVTDPAPVVTPSANITGSGTTGSAVTFAPTPTATDYLDGTDPVTCTAPLGTPPATTTVTSLPASGATVFPVGTTTVACSATNSSNVTGTATFTVTINSVTPSSTDDNVKGEVPNGTSPGGLQITAQPCDFGPVFIPAVAATYTCTTAATVTSTDSTATLTINDISTAATAGHLVNPLGPSYALVTPLTDLATSAAATGPTTYTALSGTATTLLNYPAPVTADNVTLKFQQAITGTEVLHNGTYGATVLLALTGTP